MSLAVVTLKKGEGRLLKSGGMWIFDNEIATIMGSFVNGDIDVLVSTTIIETGLDISNDS